MGNITVDQWRFIARHIGYRFYRDGCDHSFRFAAEALTSLGLPLAASLEVLKAFGGRCDCTILAHGLPVNLLW